MRAAERDLVASERAFDELGGVAPPPAWAPLSKAQCLRMAIELHRVRAVTQAHWARPPDVPPQAG